ncbi:T9SS type A sorting domain-containing protein [Flavobacterium subsaxonicum]|uniref:Uncharacterized protein n=1 Tax=Flavobacterium subsaxonicum WB 4.1-42 = DSM 21790 TaxID=1121898 RepID=A0A0A2MH94_9FLAO|nr:T9SS type A sorting domain-containing protein [Flavobacterium subsaxonicum]KGO90991.1 hypothetical protein Q766_20345 [Flavobacterium subsaxonicum WB 4.1-42 = DSM 21790]
MKYKLLLVLASFFTIATSFSQIAPAIDNLYACDSNPATGHAIFNMYMSNHEQILNAQDVPSDYTVEYYATQANAIAGTNFIVNSDYYENLTNPQTIYYRVQKTATGEFAIGSFQLIVLQQILFTDVVACGSAGYTIVEPAAGYGEFYTGPNGTGTLLPYGTVITTPQTIYVYFGCDTYNPSFNVTIADEPEYTGPTGTIVCDSYTLPPLDANSSYSNLNGLIAGDVITTSQQLTVMTWYGGQGSQCYMYTPVNIDVVASFPDQLTVNGCDSENNGQAYFDLTTAFYNIPNVATLQATYHKTLALAQAGTNAIDAQYTNTEELTTLYARIITDGGACSHIITINLVSFTFEYGTPDTVTGCDPDGDGFGLFNLETALIDISNGSNLQIAVFATEAEAVAATPLSTGIDSTNLFAYQNTTPFNQTLYAVVTNQGNCKQIVPITLTTTTNCTLKTVTGTVRYDQNGTGCTATSAPVANIQVLHSNGLVAFTNALGQYTIEGVTDGSVLVYGDPFGNFALGDVVFEGSETTTVADLCLSQPTNTGNDVWVSLIPTSVARPEFQANYTAFVQNSSGATTSGTLTVNFDVTKLAFIGVGSPFTASGNTLTLSYTLAPYSSAFYTLNFLVENATIAIPGQLLQFTAHVNQSNDIINSNNTTALEQVIVNSYDPNDITVHQGDVITLNEANDYLDYTIRFQNTGNADAVNIKIVTQLDADLYAGSFIPNTSSHDFSVQLSGGAVIFTFNNINLPGVEENEALSQGYISYRVRPGTVFPGAEYTAKADIYFDGNEPIATNIASTIIENPLTVPTQTKDSFIIYPNPASGTVTLQLPGNAAADVMVADILGKTVFTKNNVAPQTLLDISSLNSGMYFVTVLSEGKITTKKLIVK